MNPILLSLYCAFSAAAAAAALPPGHVDFLDYFLQKDDPHDEWTLGGTDVRADRDPDGTDAPTYVLNKFSSGECYEVFKVVGDEVQIRYEVMRAQGETKDNWWIRRFEGIAAAGAAPGEVWCHRHVDVGGEPQLFKWRQDHVVFDPASDSYVLHRQGCAAELSSYVSFVWVDNDWKDHNKSGFDLNPSLRLISEWQHEGLMIEMYDYSKGKGLVAWRWLERVSALRPMENDQTGKLFHCENGTAYVERRGDANEPPVVFKHDPRHGGKGVRLEVVKLVSHWKADLGPQWYVVFRNSVREQPLVKRRERPRHDFSLPEWSAKPAASIKDLPYLFTHPAGDRSE